MSAKQNPASTLSSLTNLSQLPPIMDANPDNQSSQRVNIDSLSNFRHTVPSSAPRNELSMSLTLLAPLSTPPFHISYHHPLDTHGSWEPPPHICITMCAHMIHLMDMCPPHAYMYLHKCEWHTHIFPIGCTHSLNGSMSDAIRWIHCHARAHHHLPHNIIQRTHATTIAITIKTTIATIILPLTTMIMAPPLNVRLWQDFHHGLLDWNSC